MEVEGRTGEGVSRVLASHPVAFPLNHGMYQISISEGAQLCLMGWTIHLTMDPNRIYPGTTL